MRRLLSISAILVIAAPLWAQKIFTAKPGRDQIVRVETALNHLTVIQLASPVLSVAAGSQAFKVEWRGERVFVEPVEAGVSTNLFIWTRSGRLNYDLEPAGPVDEMDFAIDGPAPKGIDPPAARTAGKKSPQADPMKDAEQWMLGGTPVKQQHWKTEKHRVQVMVRDLFRENGELYIRYSVENGTRKPYSPGTPKVYEVRTNASADALLTHVYTQLDGGSADSEDAWRPLKMVGSDLRAQTIAPGKDTVGVVGVKLPGSGSAVLKLDLAEDGGHPVGAVVVI
jgi:hypothetical protein